MSTKIRLLKTIEASKAKTHTDAIDTIVSFTEMIAKEAYDAGHNCGYESHVVDPKYRDFADFKANYLDGKD